MNIAFIGAFTGIGGLQKIAALIASELSKQHAISFIDYRGDDHFHFPLGNAVKVFEVASAQNKGQRMNPRDRIGNMYLMEIDCIHDIFRQNLVNIAIFCGSFCTALIPALKNRSPGMKMIAWQHSSFQQYMGPYSEKYRDEYLRGVDQADAVVSLTNEDALCFGQFNKHSICIYNPTIIPHAGQYNIGSKQLLFVGRIAIETKGLDLLLGAFDLLDAEEWSLSIVGDGEDMHTLADMVAGSRKRMKISLKGFLTGEALLREYQRSSIFILPSRWEGFGLSLLEAMSFGLPIISTPTTGGSEVLSHGEYGLLAQSFSAIDIAKAIQKLTNSLELRNHFMEQSRKRIKDFSLSEIMPLWDNLLIAE